MSPPKRLDHPAERYDQALHYARDKHLPLDAPRPRPSHDWPLENVSLLVKYAEYLDSGGSSQHVIRTLYIPAAGHVLGLNLKPHPEIDLDTDLQPALEYIQAKQLSTEWYDMNRNALAKFRRFLLHERGLVECKVTPYEPAPHTAGLPGWLLEGLTRFQHIRQRNWRAARLEENIRRFWSGHLRVWRFLVERCGVRELSEVRRKHLYDYAEQRLSLGKSVSCTNSDLRDFRSFMIFLQEEEFIVPQALLRIRGLKQPDRLPRALTDEQVKLLRNDFEARVSQAHYPYQKRDALLDLAIFYLFWQCGLRKGEVEELRLEDLDLAGRRLSVRNGKGLKDRTVYLTDTAVQALQKYMAVRGPGPTDHVFLYRNQALSKDLIHGRLKAAGDRQGVKVHAHRLRHTTATQLLNAGCPVTSIQKFLGHKKLNTTMVYARAYDRTVEADYFAAMGRIEQRLELVGQPAEAPELVSESERGHILALTEQLAAPDLSFELRLEIALRIRGLLIGQSAVPLAMQVDENGRQAWIPPPATPLMADVELR